MESIFLKLVFPPPPSFFLNALSLMNIPSFALSGLSEMRGQNMKYSKFANYNSNVVEKNVEIESSNKIGQSSNKRRVDSKIGMLVCYGPAFIASVVMFWIFPHYEGNLRILLLNSALSLHFFKRIYEVLFVHKYSGKMVLETALLISLSYFTSTTTMIYAQRLSKGLSDPQIDLKYIGLILFVTGIIGNFYHHNLLSRLRESSSATEKYMIPKGGLFDLIICPHYLFEIIEFVGFSFIGQTPHSFSVALGTIFYLVGRSCATREWYISKFEDFPKHVKALIPFVL